MRRPDSFLTAVALGSLLMLLSWIDAGVRVRAEAQAVASRAELVRGLGLTDLALFTEARYTRHPGLADLHSPFQDHPMALEHFPTGSLVPPRPPLP